MRPADTPVARASLRQLSLIWLNTYQRPSLPEAAGTIFYSVPVVIVVQRRIPVEEILQLNTASRPTTFDELLFLVQQANFNHSAGTSRYAVQGTQIAIAAATMAVKIPSETDSCLVR